MLRKVRPRFILDPSISSMKVRPALSRTVNTPQHARYMEPSCTEHENIRSVTAEATPKGQSGDPMSPVDRNSRASDPWLPPLSVYVSLIVKYCAGKILALKFVINFCILSYYAFLLRMRLVVDICEPPEVGSFRAWV
jgi:hypothetical protein